MSPEEWMNMNDYPIWELVLHFFIANFLIMCFYFGYYYFQDILSLKRSKDLSQKFRYSKLKDIKNTFIRIVVSFIVVTYMTFTYSKNYHLTEFIFIIESLLLIVYSGCFFITSKTFSRFQSFYPNQQIPKPAKKFQSKYNFKKENWYVYFVINVLLRHQPAVEL